MPGWWIDVAITIHCYEAVLATLAIVVWHIYAVIFDPDAYPMNWAWFDGKMSIEHYEHEHPLDTLAIVKANGAKPRRNAVEARKSLWGVQVIVRCGTGCSAPSNRGSHRYKQSSDVLHRGRTLL